MIRKHRGTVADSKPDDAGRIDLEGSASFTYSSEDAMHPLDNILDEHCGPGGTYWASDRDNSVERIGIRFDAPQTLSRLIYEVEERTAERTQEIRVEVSEDSGVTFRGLLVQQFNFSPQGATFQREDVRLQEAAATHLRLTITPNYSGTGKATLTCLRLYS
jgi:F5/8 type C domain